MSFLRVQTFFRLHDLCNYRSVNCLASMTRKSWTLHRYLRRSKLQETFRWKKSFRQQTKLEKTNNENKNTTGSENQRIVLAHWKKISLVDGKQTSCLLGTKTKELYWLIGKKSYFLLENKMLIYKVVIKPMWTYGIELCVCVTSPIQPSSRKHNPKYH